MSAIKRRPRPPDPRLARQSDGRGRRRARVRRVRPRRGALRRLDRRARGGRAARRRCRVGRQGRDEGGRERERRDRRRSSPASTALDQQALDRKLIDLDGTPNKGRLGANAILGVSLAAAKAAAVEAGQPLYRYLGGDEAAHAPRADAERDQRRRARRQLDRPAGVHGRARRARERSPRRCGSASRSTTSSSASWRERGLATGVGDEGGFAPDLESSEAAIEAILEAAERAGHRDGVAIALDPATSEVFARRRLPLRGRASSRARRCRRSGPISSSATRSSRSRTASPRTTGTPGRS